MAPSAPTAGSSSRALTSMIQGPVRRRRVFVSMLVAGLLVICGGGFAQDQAAIYLLALDQKGAPLLDIKTSDIAIKEDVGPSTIVSLQRFGWPLKVTVL